MRVNRAYPLGDGGRSRCALMVTIPDEILTLREVAEYLKIGERTVYRLVQDGRVPGFKVGGAWRFHRAHLDKWIAEQTAVAGKTPTDPNDPTDTDD